MLWRKTYLILLIISYWEVVTCILITCVYCFWSASFSLTSFEMLNSSLRADKGFRLFNFSKVQYSTLYWIWIIISDFLFSVNVTVSYNVSSRWAQLLSACSRIVIFRSRRMNCSFKNWSYINYGELRCDSVMISLKAMNFKLQLFFLRICKSLDISSRAGLHDHYPASRGPSIFILTY